MENTHFITIAIAWCLAWGDQREPKHKEVLQQTREALKAGKELPEEFQQFVNQVQELDNLKFPETLEELKQYTEQYPHLCNSQIGLVYGGATKIKQYVFEESKLPDIRGGSGLLDQINSIDLPGFFNKEPDSNLYRFYYQDIREWLQKNFPSQPSLLEVLIPEMIIYSSGGNILAFCPAAFVNELTDAIEKRYTERTITANSCAVGECFRILELNFGLLRDNIEDTFWLEQYREKYADKIVEAYFGKIEDKSIINEKFKDHKSFNELTTKLAIRFNQRRSGNDNPNRPTRRYPPMLETHPYLRRDETEKRSAITQANNLPDKPYFSEPSAIKRRFGDRAKIGEFREADWYKGSTLIYEGWIQKFGKFLELNQAYKLNYIGNYDFKEIEIAESLTQLGNVSNGYIAYIYADINNMGGFIQKLRTPKEYQDFSQDVDNATKYAVFQALATNLQPRKLHGIDESKPGLKNGDAIHPFEIITIGGDDIILIVPADKALEIAKMIGEQFEQIILKKVLLKDVTINGKYQTDDKLSNPNKYHRFTAQLEADYQCKLSISIGVLITAYNTPIYYAEKLTKQLMKSAKDYAKILNKSGYYGSTVDFLTMKSVTMISSNIEEFRRQALLINDRGPKLKLYAAPYTLYELKGLIRAIHALKIANFPKSQLYQIRSLLERGKRTASLNYYYYRHRLKQGQNALKVEFENAWCPAKTNEGNIAPWMHDSKENRYETIWSEMVDLYDFIQTSDNESPQPSSMEIAP
ncbi:type III-B CRISPR-associated protein Cas10/Cmr2 [Nostoc sp. CENA67]|uniref:Type III-B CRISPR-associated protein Cas10/Cmr2 n=1 Tax=Amazonocrinis nigriterrae CENA67 TaxID=2794033 RepID=A0A8J7LCJ1_9NOST|nr:type III-B CRISPR-associated protein Cas10/Cmr2 [Amazonocrinis nigriterrae]MBH8566566.1 type III-B CRISPR-associated protein Cas10/Cmr2 [Amazonocrinis nigriterrae CENA67]